MAMKFAWSIFNKIKELRSWSSKKALFSYCLKAGWLLAKMENLTKSLMSKLSGLLKLKGLSLPLNKLEIICKKTAKKMLGVSCGS